MDAGNIIEKRVRDAQLKLPSGKRETKYDKSLVGRRIDRGNGDIGTITKYETDGPYHWFVKYDKVAKNEIGMDG